MIFNRYGGPWQEFRAYVATILLGWAQSVHFAATMDLAKCLAALEAEATAAIRVAAMKAEDRDQMPPWAAERLARIEAMAADSALDEREARRR
jgi:hypothetical protein